MSVPRAARALLPAACCPWRTLAALVVTVLLVPAARVALALPPPAAPDTLSVEACVALARHRAPAVVAADLAQESSAAESLAAAGRGRPELAFVGRALIAPKGFYDPTITNLGEYETKIALDYTILDGGQRARARARAALDLAAARLDAAVQGREVGLQAAELALDVLRLREVEDARRQAVEWIDQLSRLMRGAVRAGVRSTTDSVRIALERNTGEAELEKTLFERRVAEIDLLATLGLDPDSTLIVGAPGWADRPPGPEDSLRVLAGVDRQPEVAIARVEEERGRLDLVEAKRARAPTLDLSLDAGLAGADLTTAVPGDLRASDPDATFADRLRRDLGASAAIHLRAPIAQGGVRQTITSRTIALRAASVRRGAEALAQRRIALEILARWRSASSLLALARQASVGAEQNLLRVKSLYSGGATGLLELLDARRVYEDARERLADARQESRSAQFHAEDRE